MLCVSLNMNSPQVTDKEHRARQLMSDCRQHLSRGDASAAAHLLMRAVVELGEASGHSPETLRAAVAEKLSTPQDLHSLLAKLEISTSQPFRGSCAVQRNLNTSIETSRASSQQCFELAAEARNAAFNPWLQMGSREAILPVSVGSESFQCPRCQGVFALARREQHLRNWCAAAPATDGGDQIDTDSDDGMST
jgi:hypothetical protein